MPSSRPPRLCLPPAFRQEGRRRERLPHSVGRSPAWPPAQRSSRRPCARRPPPACRHTSNFIEIQRATHSPVSGSRRQRRHNMRPTLSFCYRQVKSGRLSSAPTPVPPLSDGAVDRRSRLLTSRFRDCPSVNGIESDSINELGNDFPSTLYCLGNGKSNPIYTARGTSRFRR